jgi:hypothetical protein
MCPMLARQEKNCFIRDYSDIYTYYGIVHYAKVKKIASKWYTNLQSKNTPGGFPSIFSLSFLYVLPGDDNGTHVVDVLSCPVVDTNPCMVDNNKGHAVVVGQ